MEKTLLRPEKDLHAINRLQKVLLCFGIISIVWYVALNLLIPLKYPGYSALSQTVSELSAIEAPTRSLWVLLCIPFSLFTIAFGIGIWLAAGNVKKLQIVGAVVILDAVIGLFWPPMHRREIVAAGGGTLTDTLHLVWTFIHLVFMMLMIGFGAAALGRQFRIYSIITVLFFIVFGILTAIESPGIEAGEPTPYIGIWERINMAAYMLWVAVFAIALLRRQQLPDTAN
ncbi:MAG TPA: DUF998 domain-containing protein [Chitinophagaceae bacterium]